MSEQKLIDANALMEDICESLNQMTNIGVSVDGEWLWGKLNDAIEHAPTIEPERIQALKDCTNCKHGHYNDHYGIPFCYNPDNCNEWNLWEPKDIEPERKTGEWVGIKEYCDYLNEEAEREGKGNRYIPSGMNIHVYCNQCWEPNDRRTTYCPNCGARLVQEGEDNDSD